MSTEQKIIPIGKLDDFEDGTPNRVDIGDLRLCVVRHEGQVYAVDDLCTHAHAFLSDGEFDADECAMECPLHGGLVDARTGKACGAPITRDARAYEARIVDGEVHVIVD